MGKLQPVIREHGLVCWLTCPASSPGAGWLLRLSFGGCCLSRRLLQRSRRLRQQLRKASRSTPPPFSRALGTAAQSKFGNMLVRGLVAPDPSMIVEVLNALVHHIINESHFLPDIGHPKWSRRHRNCVRTIYIPCKMLL